MRNFLFLVFWLLSSIVYGETNLSCHGFSEIYFKDGNSSSPQSNSIDVSLVDVNGQVYLKWSNHFEKAEVSRTWYEFHSESNVKPTYGIALNRHNLNVTTVQAYNHNEISSLIFKGKCDLESNPKI